MPKQATQWGHHTYALFATCPRKFLFSHLWQWEPKVTSQSAVQGSCWHAWCHVYHEKKSMTGAMVAAMKVLKHAQERYENIEQVHSDIKQQLLLWASHYPGWLGQYMQTHGSMKWLQFEKAEESSIVCPALPYEVTVAPYTTRKDAVCEWQGHDWVWECKTSGFTFDRIYKQHATGAQITGYIHDAQYHKSQCQGALVFHVRSNVKDPEKLFNMKPVIRPPHTLATWRRDKIVLWNDILEAEQNAEKYGLDIGYPTLGQAHDRCVEAIFECPFVDCCATPTVADAQKVLEAFFQKREEK